MEKANDVFYSNMGVTDSGTSSMESLPFANLERVISNLFDESFSSKTLIPQPESLTDFFIVDKLNYFNKVSSNIMETKENFLQVYASVNRTIEEMAREIVISICARKKELSRELWDIKVKKVEKWDRQLAVCEEALRQLRNDLAFSIRKSFSTLDINITNSDTDVAKLQQELEFVDAGELKFEVENYKTLMKDIRKLGTISCHNGPKCSNGGVNSVTTFAPKFTFGTSGEQPGQFCRPWGVCSDATRRILVCDRSNHRIQIFDECGQFLIEFGKEGSKPGEFNRPSGIDVDVKCRIVVADKDNHRIQVFTYSGYYMFEFGSQGSGPGQFQYPWDVSVNQNCDIAVSDSKNHRIQLFNEHGHLITMFDAASNGIKSTRTMLKFLDSPRGLAFQSDGSLLVTDFNNHRVILINKNFRDFSTFGSEGGNPGQFFRPQGIACDKTGRIAVSDSKNYRVQVFDRSGNILRVFGNRGHHPGHFDCPQGICFHPNQNILVVDLNNDRVQVF